MPPRVAQQPSELDDRIDIIGCGRKHVTECIVCKIVEIERRQRARQAKLRGRIVRPHRQSRSIGGQRLWILAHLEQQQAEVGMGVAISRIELDRFLQQFQRPLVVAAIERDHAADVQHPRPHQGLLLHGLEQHVGAVDPALAKQHGRAVHHALDEFHAPLGRGLLQHGKPRPRRLRFADPCFRHFFQAFLSWSGMTGRHELQSHVIRHPEVAIRRMALEGRRPVHEPA